MRNVSLNIVKNRENDLSEVIVDRYISEKFEFSLSGIAIKDKNKYIAHLEKELGNIEVSTFNFGFGKGQILIEAKDKTRVVSSKVSDCFIYINEYSTVSYVEVFTKTIKEAEYIFNLSKDFMHEDEEVQVRMHYYYTEGKLLFKESILKQKDLGDIIKDYYPDFTSIDEFFKQFTASKENILVLSGAAGTGKTKLTTLYLKYLIENIDTLNKNFEEDDDDDFPHVNVAYVKNEDILSMDSFWVNLREYNYDIVILDDLDYFLSPRGDTVENDKAELKRKFISNFLSFTDGLLPNKTKFIISTNRNIDSIDEALKRDGRLFGVFEFSLLKYEEAKAIWLKSGLDESSFFEEFPNKEQNILQGTLGSKIYSYLKNNKKKYNRFLKEDSKADISHKFLKSKKVGF